MKFGKLIQAIIDEALPAWKDKYLPYKFLKKRLNELISEVITASLLSGENLQLASEAEFSERRQGPEIVYGEIHAGQSVEGASNRRLSNKRGRASEEKNAKRRKLFDAGFTRLLEAEFKRLLEEELNKLNDFVVEKEEEFVIKLQDFKEKVDRLKDLMRANDENSLDVINLQKDVVVFHGEMVLLKNYSSLNYTGLVKIVKKHDRLTGAWLRLSFIPVVLRQPFYSTEILSRLVKECENTLLSVFPTYSGEVADHSFEKDTHESAFHDDSLFNEEIIKRIYKSTVAALQTMRNMGRGSSTYNVYSVPPCENDDGTGSELDEEIL